MKLPSLALGVAFAMLLPGHLHAQASYDPTLIFQPSTFPANYSSTGWNDNGDIYTANGLDLTWVTGPSGGGGTWRITNVADVTGNGPFLDRYISTTIDPATHGLSQWDFRLVATDTLHTIDLGEGFEIRSSLDGFQTPLVRFVGSTVNGPSSGAFPAGTLVDPDEFAFYTDYATGAPYTTPASLVQASNQAVEFRYYYWDTANTDGSGAIFNHTADGGGTVGLTPYTIYTHVEAVPEPATLGLTSLAALCAVRRRRR